MDVQSLSDSHLIPVIMSSRKHIRTRCSGESPTWQLEGTLRI